ncbi:DinB family protein [Chitinophaga nivalis]|uniref:DinB family protein n=1 Tax=Chitinophaga nivalis TaxID=2991709 RepID=A0ABT3IMD0_9BACT|nr:DinB family protein [Chitinophaga nivalis]MCW3465247.1 DinB family protein [Chitinophaga nivalis]MCW3485061.1 DinB family protein [Chitinophaga nivalis]
MEITSISSFLDYYGSIRARTLRLLQCVPPDQLDWSYMPGKFTIADHIRHLAAIERYMYAETVAGRPCVYSGCGKELADGYEAVMQYFHTLHAQSLTIFRSLRDEDLQQKCTTPGNIQITTWKWLRAMVEHEVHHRAQLYLYLNIIGVKTPPMFGLSSEEIIANSISISSSNE